MAKKKTTSTTKAQEQRARMNQGGIDIANAANREIARRNQKAITRAGETVGVRNAGTDPMAYSALRAISQQQELGRRREAQQEAARRRQNAENNIRDTITRVNPTEVQSGRNNQFRLNAYDEIMNRLKSRAQNEENIISNQGRAENDPARVRAVDELAKIQKQQKTAQNVFGAMGTGSMTPAGVGIARSPEENNYIRKLMEISGTAGKRMQEKGVTRLPGGQKVTGEIPRVVSRDYASFQHMINTPDKAEGQEYIDWLKEGRDVGLYGDRELNAMLGNVTNKTAADEYRQMDDSQKSSWFNLKDQESQHWDNAMQWIAEHPEGTDAETWRALRQQYQDELTRAQEELSAVDNPDFRERSNRLKMLGGDMPLPNEWEAIRDENGAIIGTTEPEPEFLDMIRSGKMPEDYSAREGDWDRWMYDFVYGTGAWQREFMDGDEAESDRALERLEELWDRFENGTIGEMVQDPGLREKQSRVDYYTDKLGETDNKLEYYRRVEDYKDRYRAYMGENSAEDDAQYDQGKYNPNDYRYTLAEKGSNNIDDIYSFIIGGKERQAYITATADGWGEKPPNISKDYRGAMLLQPDEINIFKNLYEAGKKDEALAFLDGLQFAINQRYIPFEEVQTREEARAFPILNSIFVQGANVLAGLQAPVTAVAGNLGADFAQDPNSDWYATTRYAQNTQDEIANMLGPEAGKVYLQSMNSIRNVINGVLMYKMGIPAGMLPTATLTTFGTQIYQEQMYNHLQETYDFDKAQALAVLDTALEIGEELLPIETMFATGGMNVFLRVISNMLAEGGEEFAGATAGEVLRGIITGRNSWEKRRDQIFNEGGYTDDSGNWVDIGTGKQGLAEADKQAMREWGKQIVENTAGGFFGGGFGAVYGTVTNSRQMSKAGQQVRSRQNIVGTQTGADQLITAAQGMAKGTESRKIADKIAEKVANGGKASNYQLGKLVYTMAQESNENIADIAQGTLERTAREQLAGEGVDQKTIDKVAPIVAKAAARGTKALTISERLNLASSRNAIDLLRTFIADDGTLKEVQAAMNEDNSGKASMNVQQTVRDLMGGHAAVLKSGFATRDIAEAGRRAVVAEEDDIRNAEGKMQNNGLDVIVDNVVGQIVGRKGNEYTVRFEDGSEKSVPGDKVLAATKSLATMIEYGESGSSNINDDAFNTIVAGIEQNNDMDGAQYVSEAVNAYIRFRTMGNVENSSINPETLKSIRAAAEEANRKARDAANAKGKSQEAVTPGKGTLSYDGIQYGAQGWRQKVKELGAAKAEQASALGQLVTMMGNRVRLINDENNPGLFGWEDEKGEIVINLAAKDMAGTEYAHDRSLMTIAAHELTHWIEQNSREGYEQLRQFVFDQLRAQGGENAVETLVLQTMEDYRRAAENNDRVQAVDLEGAMAEVVANACDNILSNRKVAEALQTENPELYKTVRGFVRDFVARMRSATRDMSSTRESRIIAKASQEVQDQMADIWLKGWKEGTQLERTTTQAEASQAEEDEETPAPETDEPTEPGQLTPEDSVHPESGQFSVTQMAEATRLGVIPGDQSLTLYMEDPNGKEIAALNKKPENKGKKWVKVDGVKVKITPEMVRDTPVGMLIDMGLSDEIVNKNGMTQKESARAMFAELMNMCARYRDNNLIWEIAGSEFAETFSALKNNSDPQYRNTVDFGTICSKTQAIVDVLSNTMKKRIADTEAWNKAHPNNQRIFSGLTRQDIMMVYNQTHNAKLSVPCPVCYVFSRWMGVPSLLGQMNRFQHRYVETVKDANGQTVYDKNGDAVIDWEKTSEKANRYIKEALQKYGSKEAITDAKQKLQKKIEKRDEKRPELQKKVAALKKESQKPGLTLKQQKAYEERIRKAEAAVVKNDQDADRFTKELEEVEAYNWVTQALCVQHNEGNKQVNDTDENGNYIVDKSFRLTPEEILFDLNRTGEFAGYTKNWRYRTTRGAGMGKAIMPYSGASIGDLVHGDSGRWSYSQNPFLIMDEKAARKAFENAKERVRKQNLVGGQRFQSTSDFRPEWGLDYMMSFLEMQALGSKVQMYTKVREAVDFLGSIGADLNESIMASGNGWHIATAEEIQRAKTDKELASRMGETYDKDGVKHTYVMDFSDVTGMDYNEAKANSKKYNSVQMILVGMNDVHIRLALANDDIDFVIPWHSSGNSKDVLQQLVRSVDETLTESDDYTKFQEDAKKKNRTAKQEALWNARVKLLQNGAKSLTDAEIKMLQSNPFTKELYRRFAIKGVDDDCYGVTLPKDQAEKIFPYEYWDKTSTRENADVNGRRFVEYCEAMGLTPRFAMFKNEKGYWKLLIDRKMFDNNVLNPDGSVKTWGKYREQQVVDVTKAEIGQLPTTATAKYGDNYKEETIRAIENSTAALRRKYDVEPSNNPYVEEDQAEEPARQMSIRQEEYAEGEEDRQYSIDQNDMDVRVWMQGLTDGSVSTAQEKAMLKQYQTLAKDLEVERGLLFKRRQALREMQKNPNPSVYDRKKMRDAQATIEAKQKKLDAKERKLMDMTSETGFAKLMYDQAKIMNDLVNGRTVEEVQQTVDDMSGELDMITKQMAEREKEIADLKQKAIAAVNTLENVPGAEAAANQLKVIVSQMTLNEKNLQRAKTRIGEVAENAKVAGVRTGNIQKAVNAAIAYNNKLTEQSEAATWQEERRKLVNTLRSEHTQAMLRQQSEFKLKLQKDEQIQKIIRENTNMARKIDLNVNRVRAMMAHENTKVFAPERIKPIAREMLRRIVVNEATGKWKLTGFDSKQLAEIDRLLKAWEVQDGKYSPDNLQGLDEGLADALVNALEQLQAGLDFLNATALSKDRLVNIQAQKNALTKVYEAVTTITGAIYAERNLVLGNRKESVEQMAYRVQAGTNGRQKKERTGKLGMALNEIHKAVISGNLTPEYFFKMLKNGGLSQLWEEYHRQENRNGLLLQKAKEHLEGIADKYGYKNWDTDKTVTVTLKSGDVQMTLGQLMALYATWKRENTLGPQMSEHLKMGGFYVEQGDPRKGILGSRTLNLRAHRVNDEDMEGVEKLLTQEQKAFVDDVVSYMSNEMSEIGNEASMKAYGIKMYKEKYYYPFKIWDGVKSKASNDAGKAAGKVDAVFHPSFSKGRLHGANNAVILGDFLQTAADHIVGMINYATIGVANENLQKVLNAQVPEGTRLDTMTKRSIRAVLQEAYGREAMDYMEKVQEQMNGGVQRVERSLYDRALTLFRKNAVAGSMSVTLQQPLSYIRAAMLINPKYLVGAISPQYWKGSFKEMMAHSGVAVIKKMGRFDMGFGAGAREYITPEGKEGKIRKAWDTVTDKSTILPELFDQMTWTRMWSAVKMEQHDLHQNMDTKSDEFLDMCGTRFNEVMRRTQVYDSVLTKSQNMRSQNPFVKSITSFMAEPTLTLNVLADAMQNIGQKGGKTRAVKALATFALSAAAQAAVKALMSSGRTPDEKKTFKENWLYRFYANLLNEGDLLNLVPGYNDLITLLKSGKLEDDALGMAGKISKAFETTAKMFNSGAGYREIEDGVGQIVQLFTQLPAKNIMRDLRAMYNWFIGKPYADRETSAAVLKYQAIESRMTADNLLGVIVARMGEAGYKTTNAGYYGRMFDAIQAGNQEEADAIREYLTLGKGVKEESIETGLKKQAKENLGAAEATEWMLDEGMLKNASTITSQYKDGEITADEAKALYKKADPEMTDDAIWWKLDKIDWQKETGLESGSEYYYRLSAALESNRTPEISDAVKLLMEHGRTKENIREQVNREMKQAYLEADSAGKVKIRDAMQKAYKAAGYTAADADKTIEGWKKTK